VADAQDHTPPHLLALMAIALLATVVFAVVVVQNVPTIEFGTQRSEFGTEADVLTPGVYATFTAGGRSIERTMGGLDIRVERGAAIDDDLPTGPFEASFVVLFDNVVARQAYVGAQIRGGQLIVRRDDRVLVSDHAGDDTRLAMSTFPIPFAAGRHRMIYEFNTTGDGPYVIRGLWRSIEWNEPRPLLGGEAASRRSSEFERVAHGQRMEDRSR
jgi:hypothetical protein